MKKERSIAIRQEDCLKIYRKIEVSPSLQVSDIVEMKFNDMPVPRLTDLVKDDDKSMAIGVLIVMVVELVEFHGEDWSDMQVQTLSEELYSKCFIFSVAEWKLFFSRCRNWHYGKGNYHKLSPAAVLDWAGMMLGERQEYFAGKSRGSSGSRGDFFENHDRRQSKPNSTKELLSNNVIFPKLNPNEIPKTDTTKYK